MKIINDKEKILRRLRKQGAVSEIKLTDEQINDWENQLKKIREDSIRKQNKSWQSAKDVYLD
jgi:hypothetical protein